MDDRMSIREKFGLCKWGNVIPWDFMKWSQNSIPDPDERSGGQPLTFDKFNGEIIWGQALHYNIFIPSSPSA